jgi:hypothetical protein
MSSLNVPATGAGDRDLLAAVERLTAQVSQMGQALTQLTEEAATARVDRDRLLTIKDLADRWSASERKIHGLVAEGALVPTHIGALLRFTRSAVEAYERSASGLRHARRVQLRRRQIEETRRAAAERVGGPQAVRPTSPKVP